MLVATVVGHLGHDATQKWLQSGQCVAHSSLAVNIRQKEGEKTLWIKLTAWGRLAEILAEYGKKGKGIAASGELDLEEWTGRDGVKRSGLVMQVQSLKLLSGPKDADKNSAVASEPVAVAAAPAAKPSPVKHAVSELFGGEEIPF